MAVSSVWSSWWCVLDHTRRGRDPNPGSNRRARRAAERPATIRPDHPGGGTLARVSTDPKDRWLDLGSFIREQRGSARLSLRRLSELAGISNPYLSQIERGLRRPSAEILQQIAKALRISAETLYVQAGILEAADRLARPDPGHPGRPDASARSRSRPSSASTSPSAASTRTSAASAAGAPRPRPAPGRGPRLRAPPPPPGRRSRRALPAASPAPERPNPASEAFWRPPVGSDRHAPARRPFPAHVAAGPARHG